MGVSAEALAVANNLSDADHITVGEVLVVPGRSDLTGTAPARRSSSGPLAVVYRPASGTPVFPARLAAHPERLRLRSSFQRWAAESGVPAGLLEATAWMESGWQSGAVSSTGAVGVGQLEPPTVRFVSSQLLGVSKPLNPRHADANIRMSAAYLRWLLGEAHGDVAQALGAYYQGMASLSARGPWDDSRAYVATIGLLWQQFRDG